MHALLIFATLLLPCYSMHPTRDTVTIKKPIFRSVRFVDDMHDWVAGYKGIFYTNDGGKNWQKQPIIIGSITLYTSTAAVRNTGWIAWANKELAIIRTDTGLATGKANSTSWQKIAIPSQILERLNAIAFANKNDGWGAGSDVVYRTRNGGYTWENVKSPASTIVKGLFVLSPTEAWMTGESTTLLHTLDDGLTFHDQKLHSNSTADLLFITFVTPNYGWACGTDGLIYHTSNGGIQWKQQPTSFSKGAYFSSLSFVNQKEGWAVGSKYIDVDSKGNELHEGIVLYTSDSGSNWLSLKNNIKDSLLDIQALPNGKAWVVGINGTVMNISSNGNFGESIILN